MNLKFLYIVDKFLYHPYSGIRTFEISKRLIKYNFLPIIVTQNLKKEKINDFLIESKILNKLPVITTNYFNIKIKYIKILQDFIFKIDFYFRWIPFAYFKLRKILEIYKNQIKFIYASGPSFETHIIGYLLKKKFKIPLILEYNDPWSFNPYNKDIEPPLNRLINYLLEIKILKSTDIIISLSTEFNHFLKKHFPFVKNKKFLIVDNGINFHLSQNKKKKKEKITFTFIGTLYGKRKITPFLNLISVLKFTGFLDNEMLEINIFGKYPKKRLNFILKKLKIDDMVNLNGFLNREEIYKNLIECDLPIHIGDNTNYPTLAYKIWEYLSCRKKILFIGNINSFTAKFIKKNNLGIILPLNDLQKSLKILKQLILDIKNKKFNTFIDKQKLIYYTWDERIKKLNTFLVKYFKIKNGGNAH
ncbi:MAG: hypothetical protein ACTSRP_11110 [Candidatus Helarchaeota archaeon]